jgi:hypothetical protein
MYIYIFIFSFLHILVLTRPPISATLSSESLRWALWLAMTQDIRTNEGDTGEL